MRTLILSIVFIAVFLTANIFAQKRTIVSTVCGDPSAACAKRAMFDDNDIPFSFGDGAIVAETAPFYVVILKSVKLSQDANCEDTPAYFSRRDFQWSFLRNKVFIARGCYSLENNYYTNIGENVIALAVYAGNTKAQADAILKKVRSLEHILVKDAYILRIATGFNGT